MTAWFSLPLEMTCGKDAASVLCHEQLIRFPRQLFIHCVASLPGYRQLAPHVPGVDKYSERALLMARAQDLVCLAHQVSPTYLDFLNRLELGPDPSHIIQLHDPTGQLAAVPMPTRLQDQMQSGMSLPKVLADSHVVWLNCFAVASWIPSFNLVLPSMLESKSCRSISTTGSRSICMTNKWSETMRVKWTYRCHLENR